MLFRKYEARDLEKACWTKRCHGVALREQTRLFSGLVLEADPFIADVAWLNPRIFSSFDTLRVYRARLARQNHSWAVFRQVRSTMETRYEYVGIIERDLRLWLRILWPTLNHVDYAGRSAPLCRRPESFQTHDTETCS